MAKPLWDSYCLHHNCLFLVVIISITSCAHPTPLAPDKTLIRDWTDELARTQPSGFPYFVHYKKDKKALFYVAAEHGSGLDTPTFRLIKRLFDRERFDVAVIEGVPRNNGVSPAGFLERARKWSSSGFLRGGEVAYTAFLADANRIPFVGAEPDSKHILGELTRKGYSTEDLLGTYFVRQIPQFQREGRLKEAPLEQLYVDFIARSITKEIELAPTQVPDFSRFKTWYQEKNGKPFALESLDPEESAPVVPSRYFTQKVNAAIGVVRNNHIVDVIAEMLNAHDRVIVVYGGSHLLTQKAVLDKMLGAPVFQGQ